LTQSLLDRRQAAEYLKARNLPAAVPTLEKYATVGGGPAFVKFGRAVRYRREDLDLWIAEKLSRPVRSTSELAVREPAHAAG
jgi:hypothetical protein